jgi:GT2 family glycosyltransferase
MSDWTARLQEVNRTGGLVIAHLHPGEVSTTFQQSLMNTISANPRMQLDGGRLGLISTHAGAGQLDRARNDAVRAFLDDYDADLLLFVDSDMGWEPEAPEQLARALEHHNLPILGGLCFGQKVTGQRKYQAPDTQSFPTLYAWNLNGNGFDTKFDYPPDAIVEVSATGGAFLMITRSCLEAIREAEGDEWFTPVRVREHAKPFGEDMSFCMRARRNDFPVHVHTGVRTTHRKDHWITEADYRDSRRPAGAAVTVVIPVKDNLALTRTLLGDLVSEGGYTDILIFDNGSGPETREWLEAQSEADVFDAEGAGIHDMWNAGIEEALRRHGGMADVVFLNNDIRCGPRFLRRLVGGMRDSMTCAVSGNYDGRPGAGVIPLQGICANRYDGTGGLAGFAFALRAEWIQTGYRFPTDMMWWFGDNDLCLSIEKAGGWYGMALDALCEHVGGGSNTETPEDWDAQIAKDQAAFLTKWPTVKLTAA